MPSVDIDFEAFKALTMLRATEDVTYNDVIRQLLKLKPIAKQAEPSSNSEGKAWTVKGITFPEGTPFKAVYKGKTYKGEVQDGVLVVDGARFTTPSSAARAITNTNINGWRFWQCKLPGDPNWTLLETIWRRKQF